MFCTTRFLIREIMNHKLLRIEILKNCNILSTALFNFSLVKCVIIKCKNNNIESYKETGSNV